MSKNITLDIEKIKNEKDGLDVLSDLYIYAVLGEKVSEEDLVRFKWYGIYPQEDASNYFKLRIPLTLGQLNLEQIKTLSFISKEYAKDSIDFSQKQKVELKWLRIHDLPHIFNLLHTVDLTTIFAAGHTIRNIVTCPINTKANPQEVDVSDIAKKFDETFIGNKNFSNLPNKLQMGISGWGNGCLATDIAQVNFDATIDQKGKVQYSVKILKSHIGYITPSQVIPTAKAIAKLYKEYGNRDNKLYSSFESLIDIWGLGRFYDVLTSMVHFKIKDLPVCDTVKNSSEHFGILESIEENKSYIGCKNLSDSFGSQRLDKLVNLLEKFEASRIKVTNKGHIIILDANSQTANEFAKELKKIDLDSTK